MNVIMLISVSFQRAQETTESRGSTLTCQRDYVGWETGGMFSLLLGHLGLALSTLQTPNFHFIIYQMGSTAYIDELLLFNILSDNKKNLICRNNLVV